jgi:SAM-dependent methyltransferase
MSGFEERWLDLREPADVAARDAGLLAAAAAYLGAKPQALAVDLGCGTGSTLRALGPLVPGLRWRLVDNDPALLAEAERRRPAGSAVETVLADLGDLDGLELAPARLATASALFDLASRDFVAGLAARLARGGIGLYAALSYDGTILFDEAHPQDQAVVAAFNAHQRGDKGLGPALGPDAGAVLAEELDRQGLDVRTASSPWRLGSEMAGLQARFVEGMATAVRETGIIPDAAITAWLDARRAAASSSGCRVGHLDVLALPR